MVENHRAGERYGKRKEKYIGSVFSVVNECNGKEAKYDLSVTTWKGLVNVGAIEGHKGKWVKGITAVGAHSSKKKLKEYGKNTAKE